jgi:isocitrate dehydrogenase
VATMSQGDFRHTERSVTIPADDTLRIEFKAAHNDTAKVLKDGIGVKAGAIADTAVMRAADLDDFLAAQVATARAEETLFSLHLKATMMKVSDPIIFGHAVRVFLPDTFARFGKDLAAAGLIPDNGLASILTGISSLPNSKEIQAEIEAELATGPKLAMVDSDRGITNLHVPSDVIVDASMPAMIRIGGHMWGPDGSEQDTLAVIPDSSYAGVYQAIIEDCQANGAFEATSSGCA